MIFSSLAFIRYSIDPWFSAGQPVFCMQCKQNDVDVVDTQLQAVPFEVAPGVGEIGRVRLGLDHVLVAGNALQGLAQIDVRAVLIGNVEEPDAMVEGVADDPGEFLDPEPGLVAGLAAADAAGAHADQRDLDAGLAQRDRVGRALGQGGSVAARAPAAPWARSVVTATAAVAETAAWAMKSRRFRGAVMTSFSPVIRFRSTHSSGLQPNGRTASTGRDGSRGPGLARHGPRF